MEGQQTISELAEGVTKEMERLQFSPLTIRAFRLDVRNLRKYVQEKTGSDFFSEEIGASYLRERFDFPPENPRTLTNTERAGIRCVRRLGEYKAYGLIMRNKTPAEREWQLDDKNLISAYVEAMQTADNSERTKKRRMQDIRSFYDYMSARGLSGAREVSAQIISDYIVTLQGYSPVYNKHRLTTLRNYFRFLTASGFLETDWSQSVPTVVAATNRTIPALWEKSEIERLLSNIDRGNPVGRRDYAVILLIAQLGLRISDVADLRLDSFKWSRREIRFVQRKTGKAVVQPLPENVGWAVIDCIRYARPKTDSPFVFLTSNAPYTQMRPVSVGSALAKCMKHCGITKTKGEGTVSGMHSLRHALARRLLEADVPLDMVADIMGHASYSSTSPYLKVDVEGLRKCALSLEEALTDG